MTKTTIINCHEASIQKDPTDPSLLDETIATLPVGKTVLVDFNTVYWSWDDRVYYKVGYGMNEDEGFILCDLVESR